MKTLTQLAAAPRVASVGLATAALLLAACSQAPVTVTLHSLQASGNMSFVCQADDGSGLKLDECPDYENQRRRMLGLVTQTATNEVAIVDLRGGTVVDVDPSTPGYTFLRVGARPGAIVSTPGGGASFVAVTGLQKNGIFALPTTCLNAPKPGQAARDLTSWSACALSSAPGDMQLLLAPDGSSCRSPMPDAVTASQALQAARDCDADLSDPTKEGGPRGQRKLLVALPEEHKLVLLDAQKLLDEPPGAFRSCEGMIDADYPLQTALPTGPIVPELPDDLKVASDPASANTCQTTQYPPASATDPTPGGMALSGTQLYVADRSLPVVHVLDVSDPCLPFPGEPLLPHSYLAPNRVVTTSRVAVSPLTPTGKQFVYAIDEDDQPTASVMVFDVSAGVTNRTPVIFPGAPRQPFSAPDRLRFSAPVRDVGFVMRDFPTPDAVTGVGQFGLLCDPKPNSMTDATSAAAQYRPNSDFTLGARPLNLRGVFGFVLLTNGQIPIIDVEDFDAPCRRPLYANNTPFQDFRGCQPDAAAFDFFTLPNGLSPTGLTTVTNESSCNVIETNRARAGALSISNSTVGLRAPTLRALPQFSNPDPSAVLAPQDQPHVMAVDLPNPDPAGKPISAQVNVAGQPYAACANAYTRATQAGKPPPPPNSLPFPCDGTELALENDPLAAVQNSLTLPLIEPRSYAGDESPTLTFEGRVIPDRTSGFLQQLPDGQWSIQDPGSSFCSGGVEDSQAILSEASELGIPAADQPAWADAHADYVQITGDFLADTDAYWSHGSGQNCFPSSSGSAGGRNACVSEFGPFDDPTLLKTRELSIVGAYSDHLIVGPRNGNSIDEVKCCFPAGTPYTVRASHQWFLSSPTALHDIAAAAGGRCVHTAACDPRKKYFRSRAFEVCDREAVAPTDTPADDLCLPGAANIGCIRAFTAADPMTGAIGSRGAIDPGQDGSQCIFENLTARFAVYRGAKPSARDMSFTWNITGGFTPLAMSLAGQSAAVNPQSMVYIPELGYMAVVDGSTLGLALFDLNSLGVVLPSPYF